MNKMQLNEPIKHSYILQLKSLHANKRYSTFAVINILGRFVRFLTENNKQDKPGLSSVLFAPRFRAMRICVSSPDY